MKEQLIDLAKEKGFYSNIIGKSVNTKSEKDFYYLWMCHLQKWLREVHNIQVYVYSHTVRGGKKGKSFGDYIYVINPLNGGHVLMADARDEEYQSYEEALEKGLEETLKII